MAQLIRKREVLKKHSLHRENSGLGFIEAVLTRPWALVIKKLKLNMIDLANQNIGNIVTANSRQV